MVIGSSLRGFMKVKSRVTNLKAFCDKMPSLMNGERAVDVVYLNFSKAFSAASHNILVDKLSEVQTRELEQ